MIYSRQVNPLKRRRVEKSLTQRQMSEKLGITQSQYSKIETGKQTLPNTSINYPKFLSVIQKMCSVVKF